MVGYNRQLTLHDFPEFGLQKVLVLDLAPREYYILP